MPSNTKNIITDASAVPVPQFFNTLTDAYESLEGTNGGIKVNVQGTPNVAVTSLPNVTLAGTSSVAVTSLPNVTLAGTPNVAVTSLPSVTLAGTSSVAVTTLPNVTLAGIPAVYLSNSDLQENPFNTKEGQSVVSVSETFWARLNRLGRPSIYNGAAVAVSAVTDVNAYFNSGVMAPKGGFRLYPKKAIVSCDTDAVLVLNIQTATYVDAFAPTTYRAFCKAGTPLILDFDGEVYIDGGGQMAAGVQTTLTTAKMWWTIEGTEVSV